MNLQYLADGLLLGSTIGLGAIGLTITYSILRFANFTHGDMISWGAYFALTVAGLLGGIVAGAAVPLAPFSFGWTVVVATLIAMALTGLLALALDQLLFRRLRRRGSAIAMVIASFGASLALRSLLEFVFTPQPTYFSTELQFAVPIARGLRLTPDQIAVLGLTLVLFVACHLWLTRSQIGRAMRATSENPSLARVVGIDVDRVVRITWLLGGSLACASGVMTGLVVQIRPYMGFDLLLALFAAAILGGIGSVPGAVLGGLIVGLAESLGVWAGAADYREAISFLVLIAILLVRPTGLFGSRAR